MQYVVCKNLIFSMINDRIKALREVMRTEHIDAFIFPSTDPHNGEYVPDHWKNREFISGFDGSAGTAVVTLSEAALWTDSRYFIAAAAQLEGTEYRLMKEKMPETPTIVEWLKRKLSASGGTCVGVDGMVMANSEVEELIFEMRKCGITVRTNFDPLSVIWHDRPEIPLNPIEIHPLEYAGESVSSKLCRIREMMRRARAEWHLVTMLDDIAWTLNLRGTDVHCTPVFVAYLLIGFDSATLFVDARKLTPQVLAYLKENGIKVREYGEVKGALDEYVLADPATTCYTLFHSIKANAIPLSSPIPAMKCMKNDVEVQGYRTAMLKDGVAMVKFLRWLCPAVARGGQTELSVDAKLTALRAEQQGFKGLSFDTIAAYEAHGAIVHYEATAASDVPLAPKGFLLLDSGAQYLDGTTDITRTIPLGPLTEEQRHIYTMVLKGHIDLAMAKFPEGASGTQIDMLARQYMWQEGFNFLHGTGHGVGSYLSVHEGPHQIRMEYKPQPLHPNMTVTNEPGLYLEGKFGVRIENTMLVTPYMRTDFGSFLQLEPLTLCPIATSPIILDEMKPEQIAYLNAYHAMVRERLLPLLDDEQDRDWLVQNTAPISC